MNCRDCLHFKACYEMATANGAEEFNTLFANKCEDFTDRSEWVHLPCKVGDMVYYPWIYDGQCGIAFSEVESIKIYVNGLPIAVVEDWGSDMPMPISFTVEDFGKTVFLTREEAEKALEVMK